jgi:cytochrome c556
VGDTRAKPEIWREQAKFNEAANKMQMEVGKVVIAGKSGNLDSLKQVFGGAAQSCKACHDAYRKD